MLDTMSNGRIVAGMLRGTPNENVTYNTNPAESRARFEEACSSSASAGPNRGRSAGRAGSSSSVQSRSGRVRFSSRIRQSSCRARARNPPLSPGAITSRWDLR